MTIGNRIKELRENQHITQEELAKSMNSTKQTIYKYENNIVMNIPFDKIEMIAAKLGTTPSYLLGWDEIKADIKKIGYNLDVLDAKISFNDVLRHIIRSFGYSVEENFAKNNDRDTTVLFEGKSGRFEIKESSYNEFVNNVFSFIDFSLNRLINEGNRVESNFYTTSFAQELNAAHEIEDATDEERAHDEDIMNDDNF